MNNLVLGVLLLLPLSVTTAAGDPSRQEKTCEESISSKIANDTKPTSPTDSNDTSIIATSKSSSTSIPDYSLVSNFEQLNDKLHLRLISVKTSDKGTTKVTLAFENWGQQAIKVTNLMKNNALRMELANGSAFNAPTSINNHADILVPVKGAVKRSFFFDSPAEDIDRITLWDKPIKIV